MMKQNKNVGKLLACLLALALSCAAAGCGNGNDGEGQDADAMAEADSQTPESIGAGADVDTELNTEPEKEDEEPLQCIDNVLVSESGDSTSTICPTISNFAEESVEASLLGFLLDGVAVDDWHVSENMPLDTYDPETVSFTLDPGTGRNLPIVLNVNIYDYTELTVQASVTSADGKEQIPLSATFLTSELLKLEDMEVASTGSSDPVMHIEAQELYNADGIVVTVPEQTLQYSYEPEIHLENSNDFDLYISFMNLTVDGNLIQEGSHNTSDAFVSASGSSDSGLPVKETLYDIVYSGTESGEIAFVLFLTENQNETFGETAVTIPYTITRE